jgi:hypothetical protein
MRRPVPILRCKCPRCITVTGVRILAIFIVCTTVAASWYLLIEDHKSVPVYDPYLVGLREQPSNSGSNESFTVLESSSENGNLRPSPLGANSAASTNSVPNPGLSRSGFNAALAAGLIDPSRIEFANPYIPPLSPSRERAVSLIGPGMSFQNPAPEMESGVPLVTDAVEVRMGSPAANPTKPIDTVSSLALAMDNTVSAQRKSSTEGEADGKASALHRPKDSISRNKPSSVRLVSAMAIRSSDNSSTRENMRRNTSLTNGAKVESSTVQRTKGHDSPSPDFSDTLQQFASDFVRANQTDNIAEEYRFFAESVHFYREGDLSLASVVAATQRHHRDQQAKRSEPEGPAVATGPVNGGFFVIQQPVRWSQAQGSKVTQGRSVLQLRVVPINHGGWKITSIDEVEK